MPCCPIYAEKFSSLITAFSVAHLSQNRYIGLPNTKSQPVKANIFNQVFTFIQEQYPSYPRVDAFLYDLIIPFLEIDLSKTPGFATQNKKVIEIYQKLEKLKNNKGEDIDFFQVIDEFINSLEH